MSIYFFIFALYLLIFFLNIIMKINYLSILCTSVVLAGCASNSSNQNAQNTDSAAASVQSLPESAQPVDDAIDWNTPLYSIDKNGDTSERFEYRPDGKLFASFFYSENKPVSIDSLTYDNNGNLVEKRNFYDGTISFMQSWKYDSQNRIISTEYSGESDDGSATYTYEGNKRIESSEDGLSETVYKDLTETYYDNDGNDTLIVRSSQKIREHSDTERDYTVKPNSYITRKTYVTINGKKLLKSSVTNKTDKDGKSRLYEQKDYEYDNLGRVTKHRSFQDWGDGAPVSDDTFTYTYNDNCQTTNTIGDNSRDDMNGLKTYFKKK